MPTHVFVLKHRVTLKGVEVCPEHARRTGRVTNGISTAHRWSGVETSRPVGASRRDSASRVLRIPFDGRGRIKAVEVIPPRHAVSWRLTHVKTPRGRTKTHEPHRRVVSSRAHHAGREKTLVRYLIFCRLSDAARGDRRRKAPPGESGERA